MDKSPNTLKRRLAPYVISAVIAAVVSGVSIAFAGLTFTGSSVTAPSGIVIDGSGSIAIGTSSASGITIGSSGITTNFPGTVTIGNTTYSPTSGALSPITISTAGPVTVAATGFYINNAGGALTYNLPTITSANIGAQFCFRNAAGNMGAITLQAPSLTFIDNGGTNGSASGTYVSSGALDDSACVLAVSTTQYMAYPGSGTWTNN